MCPHWCDCAQFGCSRWTRPDVQSGITTVCHLCDSQNARSVALSLDSHKILWVSSFLAPDVVPWYEICVAQRGPPGKNLATCKDRALGRGRHGRRAVKLIKWKDHGQT